MLSKDSTKEVLCDKSIEEKKISEAFAVVEEDELQKKKKKKKKKLYMVLICYSTGSREILGYIPLVFGRAVK